MISHLSSITILYHFRDIIMYFPKFKDVTWPRPCPIKWQFVIPMLNHHIVNHCTKFKVSSFSHSGDILGGTKNLNGSCDHNHTPFRYSLSSVGWDYLWSSYVPNLKSLCSPITKIWKATKNAEIGVQGHWQHSHSIECICLPIQLCTYLVPFSSIIAYFPKLKDVTWPCLRPIKGQFIIQC